MISERVKIFLLFSFLCFLWGSTWLAIRVGLDSLTPMFGAGIRFFVASLAILVIMKFRKIKIQKDKLSIKLYIIMGIFSFVLPYAFVYWGEQYVPSGLSSVLFAVHPFFVALFSYFFISSETIGIYKLLGIILGFSGIVVIFSDSFSGDFSTYIIGMIAVLMSGVFQAGIAVTMKKYGHHLNPLSMNLIPMEIAAIVLTIYGLIFENTSYLKFDLNAVISIIYLAIFGSVFTFTIYYWLLKRVNVVMLSLMAFITPIVALVLGWIILSEALSTRHFIGSALVLIGLLTANFVNLKKLNKENIIKQQPAET